MNYSHTFIEPILNLNYTSPNFLICTNVFFVFLLIINMFFPKVIRIKERSLKDQLLIKNYRKMNKRFLQLNNSLINEIVKLKSLPRRNPYRKCRPKSLRDPLRIADNKNDHDYLKD